MLEVEKGMLDIEEFSERIETSSIGPSLLFNLAVENSLLDLMDPKTMEVTYREDVEWRCATLQSGITLVHPSFCIGEKFLGMDAKWFLEPLCRHAHLQVGLHESVDDVPWDHDLDPGSSFVVKFVDKLIHREQIFGVYCLMQNAFVGILEWYHDVSIGIGSRVLQVRCSFCRLHSVSIGLRNKVTALAPRWEEDEGVRVRVSSQNLPVMLVQQISFGPHFRAMSFATTLENDEILLKLWSDCQHSVGHPLSAKLSRRFYGQFLISEHIGKATYKLHLPVESRLCDVFHVSLLRLNVPPCASTPPLPLPSEFSHDQPLNMLIRAAASRTVFVKGVPQVQWFVYWSSNPSSHPSWELGNTLLQQFPTIRLEDKAISEGGGVDRALDFQPDEAPFSSDLDCNRLSHKSQPTPWRNRYHEDAAYLLF